MNTTLLEPFIVGAVASVLFNTIGGVGIVTQPALIWMGLSTKQAIATDLFSMIGGQGAGLVKLHAGGKVDIKLGLFLSVFTLAGAIGGTVIFRASSDELMRTILGYVILSLAGIVLLKGRFGQSESVRPSKRRRTIGFALAFFVGVWSTMLGSGFALMATYLLVMFFGKTLLESAGTTKICGVVSGLVVLVVYGSAGEIVWPVGLSMLVGKIIGAYLGNTAALLIGDRPLRWIFVVTAVLSGAKMLSV